MCKDGKHTFDKRYSARYRKGLQPCDCLRKQLEEVSAEVAKWPAWMKSDALKESEK